MSERTALLLGLKEAGLAAGLGDWFGVSIFAVPLFLAIR